MVLILKEILKWMIYMAMECINGWMEETIKGSGSTIKCGEWEKQYGRMEDLMKEGNIPFN